MMIGLNDNKVRRFVDNEFGAVNNGQPVYPEFNDAVPRRQGIRAADRRLANPHRARRRIDAGDRCSARKPRTGQIRILDELVVFNPKAEAAREDGADRFAREAALPRRACGPAKVGEIWGDPAGFSAAAARGRGLAWMRRSSPRNSARR
jgi:hypothetical protein